MIIDSNIVLILNLLNMIIVLGLCREISLFLGDIYLSIYEWSLRVLANNSQMVKQKYVYIC